MQQILAGQGVCEERRAVRTPIFELPRFYINKHGTYSGIDIDLIRIITRLLKWEVLFLECPWKRCLLMMESGVLDVVGYLVKAPERLEYMYFIDPPYQYSGNAAFYFLKGKGSDVKTYNDLNGLTIGVVIGARYFEPFDSDATLDKFQLSVDEQRFKMLQTGRIDTFLDVDVYVDFILKNNEFKGKFEKAPYVVKSKSGYFGISKKSPYAKDRFKFGEVLKQLIDSGKVKEIHNKYGFEWHPPTQQAPK